MSFFDRFLAALGIRKPEQAEMITLPPAGADPAEKVESAPGADTIRPSQKPVGVHEHSYIDLVIKPATCTTTGVKKCTCSECGAYRYATIPASHVRPESGIVTVEPTCVESGCETYNCSVCGQEVIETIPATGVHTWVPDTMVSDATCTEPVRVGSVCAMCGALNGELVSVGEPLGHEYTSEITVAATCTEPGVVTFTCSRCGDSYTESIPATGHTEGDSKYIAATCTESGKYITRCAVCGEPIIEDNLGDIDPALGHDYVAEVTEPTCIKGGFTTYTCSRCGDSYVASETKPTGTHTPIPAVVMKAPTCQSAGIGRMVCKVCGEELGYGRIPALEHTWVTDDMGRCTCSQCGTEKDD